MSQWMAGRNTETAKPMKTSRTADRMAPITRAFASFEWMIALRYLRAKRKESFVSVISGFSLVGIALGVATLIIVMAVMNGFRHELLSRILGLSGHVVVQGSGGELMNFDEAAAKVRAVRGVTRVSPVVDGQVMATANGVSRGALVRGIRRADLEKLTTVSKTLSPGALARFQGGDLVIIGWRMAQQLGIGPGMTITLIAPRGNITPFGTTPRVKTYTIVGIFNIGMSEYDETFVFMPLEEAQLYFNLGNGVSGLEAMVAQPDDVANYASAIARGRRSRRTHSDLEGRQLQSVRRPRSRTQCDVPYSHPHHFGGRAQHCLGPHHACEG